MEQVNIKTIISLYKNYKPLSFFLWLAILLVIIGTIFLIPVLLEFYKTGLVPKMPTFMASIFFFICATQSFFGGLMLQTIVEKDKRQFEITLNEYEDKFKKLRE